MCRDLDTRLSSISTELHDITAMLRSLVLHWEQLPVATRRAYDYARACPGSAAGNMADVLSTYVYKGLLSLDDVRMLGNEYDRLMPALRVGEYQVLREQLHNTLLQSLGVRYGVARWFPGIIDICSKLHALPLEGVKSAAMSLQKSVTDCRNGEPTLPDANALLRSLTALKIKITEAASGDLKRWAPMNSAKFTFLIVDDHDVWRQFALSAVEAAIAELGWSDYVATVVCKNVAEAKATLQSRKFNENEVTDDYNKPESRDLLGGCLNPTETQSNEAPVFDHRACPSSRTVAIIDMGLPLDQSDPDPLPQNGLTLLSLLRSYKHDIPCIVLTAGSDRLEDQERACGLGINDEDYIVKDYSRAGDLKLRIICACERTQPREIQIRCSSQRDEPRLLVDGIPVNNITDAPFATLRALAQLSIRSNSEQFFTARDVGTLLADEPPEVDPAMVAARLRAAKSLPASWSCKASLVIGDWSLYMSEHNSKPINAIRKMVNRLGIREVREAAILVRQFRNANPTSGPWSGFHIDYQPSDIAELALWFDHVFGGVSMADQRYKPNDHTLEDHILEIRIAVHSAFQRAHLSVDAKRILECRRQNDETASPSAYRLNGRIQFTSDTVNNLNTSEKLRILVVENHPLHLADICTALELGGFQVFTATNVEDAVSTALDILPDMISLDMHIPATREQWQTNNDFGSEDGGLRVLEHIRPLISNLQVICPTSLYDDHALRLHATRLGVPIGNFIPKPMTATEKSWTSHMLTVADRLRTRIRGGPQLPSYRDQLCPIVEVLLGGDLNTGKIQIRVNGRIQEYKKASSQGRFLVFLLRNARRFVEYDTIGAFVERRRLITADMRKAWVFKQRDAIRKIWMSVPADDAREPEKDILESVTGGLILHVFVAWPEVELI